MICTFWRENMGELYGTTSRNYRQIQLELKSIRSLAPRTSEASLLQSNSRPCRWSELVIISINESLYDSSAHYFICNDANSIVFLIMLFNYLETNKSDTKFLQCCCRMRLHSFQAHNADGTDVHSAPNTLYQFIWLVFIPSSQIESLCSSFSQIIGFR